MFVPLRTFTAETAFSSKTLHMTWNTLGSLLIFSRRVTRRFIALASLRDSLLITLLANRAGATLPGSTSFARVSKHFSKAAIAASALMVGWSCTDLRLPVPLPVNRRKTCQLGLIMNWDYTKWKIANFNVCSRSREPPPPQFNDQKASDMNEWSIICYCMLVKEPRMHLQSVAM